MANEEKLGTLYYELEARMGKLEGDFKKVESMGARSAQKLKTGFLKVAGAVGLAFGIQQVVRFTFEAAKLAARVEGVKVAFERLNDPNLLNDLRRATRGTVSDFELMKTAMRASNFKIPLNQLATLLEFAQKRASQTGESVDYLVNSIVDGIGRKSTLVLDNLGISATELQEEVKKVGDFGRATGNIVSRELKKMGDVAETSADRIAQVNAEMENLQAEIGKEVNPALVLMLNIVLQAVKGFRDLGRYARIFIDNITSGNFADPFGVVAASNQKIPLMSPRGGKMPLMSPRDTGAVVGEVQRIKDEINLLSQALENPNISIKEYLETLKKIEELEAKITLQTKEQAEIITGLNAERDKSIKFIERASGGRGTSRGRSGIEPFGPASDGGAGAAGIRQNTDEFERQAEIMNGMVGLSAQIASNFSIAGHTFVGQLVRAFDYVQGISNIILTILSAFGTNAPGFGFGGLFSLLFGHAGGNFVGTAKGVKKMAAGGSFIVPPGFNHDSYPLMVESGERVSVTPRHKVGTSSDPMLAKIVDAIVAQTQTLSRGGGGAQPIILRIGEKEIAMTVQSGQNELGRSGVNLEQL